MTTNSLTSGTLSAAASFLILKLSASLLLPIILNITKSFYIRKDVTSADNSTAMKTLKDKI